MLDLSNDSNDSSARPRTWKEYKFVKGDKLFFKITDKIDLEIASKIISKKMIWFL